VEKSETTRRRPLRTGKHSIEVQVYPLLKKDKTPNSVTISRPFMNKFSVHVIVVAFAVSLTFSALYIYSERDQFTDVIYGSTYHILVPPNSNVTIPLGQVSDRFETDALAVNIGSWSWNQTLLVRRPIYYSVEAGLLVSVAVNKSAFVILEDYGGSNGNKTVDVKAFSGAGDWGGSTMGQTFESRMEVNHMYQLKIGNYEADIKNQTGPIQFTIENTDRSLEVLVGDLSFPDQTAPFSLPNENKYIFTFTREPNLYLVTVLLIVDLLLAVIYFALSRK
jgi:hypothetical protein